MWWTRLNWLIFWWKTSLYNIVKYIINILKSLLHYIKQSNKVTRFSMLLLILSVVIHSTQMAFREKDPSDHLSHASHTCKQLQRHFIWKLKDPFKDPSSVQCIVFVESIVQFNFNVFFCQTQKLPPNQWLFNNHCTL